MEDPKAALAGILRGFGTGVGGVGSALYGALLTAAADDAEQGGVTWRLLQGHGPEDMGSAFPLRLMGALHRFVLARRAPDLEPFYRVDGEDPQRAWPIAHALLEANEKEFAQLVTRPVQTNEVGRSAILAPGFVTIGAETNMPLRLLEVGSSGGLNLRWDRYRYEGSTWRYGPEDSILRFSPMFQDAEPSTDHHVAVAERSGCDPNPIDPTTEDGRLTLLSFVWPDQPGRLDRIRNALDIAFEVPVHIEKADAADWLPRQLHENRSGVATVVFHSVVMQYIGRRDEYLNALNEAGTRATSGAPLAWLRFEPVNVDTGIGPFELRLTMWPKGEERLLAEAHPHGPPIRWAG